MKDRELDDKLKIARHQSEQFFTKLNFEQSRKLVYKRIENNSSIKKNLFERFLNKKLLLKGTTVFLLFLVVVYSFMQIDNNKHSNRSTPILQQSIELGDNNNYLANYFIVDNPNNVNNLLAILWKKDLNGNYKIIYSSMMENANIPNPVVIMSMPFSESKFALVSSKNEDGNFIHYRFIKYNNDSITTYLEENYVPEGKIEINNGMLIEERVEHNDNYFEKNDKITLQNDKIYRYFIPIEFNNDGSFALSTNEIKLKEGSVLTLLAKDKIVPLEFEYDNDILSREDKKLSDNKGENYYANFKVNKKGFVNLKIREKNNASEVNELFIKIID